MIQVMVNGVPEECRVRRDVKEAGRELLHVFNWSTMREVI